MHLNGEKQGRRRLLESGPAMNTFYECRSKARVGGEHERGHPPSGRP